jgi:hypothetical protein
MSTKFKMISLNHEEMTAVEDVINRKGRSGFNQDTGTMNCFRMKNWILKLLFLLVTTVVIGSCAKDEEPQYLIDAPLQEYFDRFQAEAALRNIVIDFKAMMISGDIRLIGTPNVIGQCGHTEEEPNVVIVDKFYWDSADDLEREFLIFHELGHCALDRGHLDDSDGQGNCISIMTSGTGLCNINYTQANRTDLLDELFMQ